MSDFDEEKEQLYSELESAREQIVELTKALGLHNGAFGFTKREHFAAVALQALISRHDNGSGLSMEWSTIRAVEYADSLIRNLGEPKV